MGTNPQCGKIKQSLAKIAQDKIYLGQYTGFSFRKTDNYRFFFYELINHYPFFTFDITNISLFTRLELF